MSHQILFVARHGLVALGLAGVFSLSLVLPPSVAYADSLPISDHSSAVSSSEVANALANIPGLESASDQIKSSSDSDSALEVATAGVTVDVPRDPSDGVTLGSTDATKPAIDISLPNADKAQDANQVAPGTVVYASNNGSANAVQATEDGGVRMLTVIDNPDAPTTYDYKVIVPDGGHIELAEDDGAAIFGNQNQVIALVQTPWAKDANQTPIKTYFTTDGQTLTQHVEHKVSGVVYPVTADPWFWNYVSCVFGIGIPIGAAIVIASYPPSWYWINRIATGTVTTGRVNGLVNYVNVVKARCSAFIRS